MSTYCNIPIITVCLAFSIMMLPDAGMSVTAEDWSEPLGTIKLPNSGYPVIREKGESFFIESTAPSGVTDWEASISTKEGFTVELIIQSAQYGDNLIYHHTRTGWLIEAKIRKIQIPGHSIPVENLYDLTVSYSVEGSGGGHVVLTETNPRSVKVVNSIDNQNFYFVHMSGTHLFLDGFNDVNLERVAKEINLINPAFVVITDDIGHREVGAMKADLILRAFEVPVFLCPGNHDFTYSGGIYPVVWEDYYWQYYHSFDYGNIHFMSFNDCCGLWEYNNWEQRDWAELDVQDHNLIIGFNWNLADGDRPARIFLEGHEAFAGFCGNGGDHKSSGVWPTIYRTVDARGKLNQGDKRTPKGINGILEPRYRLFGRSEGGSIFDPVILGYHLPWDFAQPNDGTSRANAAIINNNIPDQEFEHGRLKFVMAPGDYVVTGGYLERSVNAGSSTVCYADVNIGEGESTVTIVPDDSSFPLAAISSHSDGEELEGFASGQESLDVKGFASEQYVLEVGKGLVPNDWDQIGSGSGTGLETPALLGTWAPGTFIDVGPWTLRLTVEDVTEDRIVVNVNVPTFENVAADLIVDCNKISLACVPVDYNNDGWEDIFVVNFGFAGYGGHTNILYQNNGDGTYSDVTSSVGLGEYDWNNCAVFFDYDNDGDQDLYIMNHPWFIYNPPPGGKNIFYRNFGMQGGWFIERSAELALDDYGYSLGGAVLDYDGDGLLDLLVVNREGPVLYKNNGAEAPFTDVTGQVGILYQVGVNYTDAAVADYDKDGDPDIYLTSTRKWALPGDPPSQPARNYLFRNDGGTFVDVTSVADVGADLFDLPWRSGGKSSYSKTAAWGDYDNDDHPDLLVTVSQDRLVDEYYDGRAELSEGELKNLLYHNTGDGTFSECSEEAGMTIRDWSMVAFFIDFDNDGDLDIFSSAEGSSYLYLNNGDGTFTDMTQVSGIDDWEFSHKYCVPNRCGIADFTGDMIPDVYQPRRLVQYAANTNPRNALFKNNLGGQKHWLKVNAVGDINETNRMGLGALIEISYGEETQTQYGEIQVGNGGFKTEPAVYFGLGDFDKVDELTIFWPSTLEETRVDVDADQMITLYESDAE